MQFTTSAALLSVLAVASASPIAEAAEAKAPCTTYITQLPTRIGIVVGSIVTETASVNCHGCQLRFTNPFALAAQVTSAPEQKAAAVDPKLITVTTTQTVCASSTGY